jgi:hypothetical protein
LIEPLVRAGASYFVCWGPGCERVHDIIDEIASYPDNEFAIPGDSCIMTTWHDSEPLDEALWFLLVNAWPDQHYARSTHATLGISIGSTAWAAQISDAFDDPREFVRRGADEDAG